MALPLTGYLNSEGRYAGFDISQKAIAWCQEHITSAHPNFQFEVSDIYNSLYNPKGKYQSLDFAFHIRMRRSMWCFLPRCSPTCFRRTWSTIWTRSPAC